MDIFERFTSIDFFQYETNLFYFVDASPTFSIIYWGVVRPTMFFEGPPAALDDANVDLCPERLTETFPNAIF